MLTFNSPSCPNSVSQPNHIYIVAREHLVEDLASDTIHQVVLKEKHEQWILKINEIERVYNGTTEKCLLDSSWSFDFQINVGSDRQCILQSDPEAVVRDYAIHASSSAIPQFHTFGYPSAKYSHLGRIRLDSILSYRLKDAAEPASLHRDIICGESNFSYCDGAPYQVLDTQTTPELPFKVVALWLYFQSDLSQEE
jgi:hypothetical protein